MATTRAKELYVIVTAGGVGRRMGGNMAKQFLELEGKPAVSSWLLTESPLDFRGDFRVEMNPGSLSVYKTH